MLQLEGKFSDATYHWRLHFDIDGNLIGDGGDVGL